MTLDRADLSSGMILGAGTAGQAQFQWSGRTAALQVYYPWGGARYDSSQTLLERRFAQGYSPRIACTGSTERIPYSRSICMLVWITKYRRPALSGEVATRTRDLMRDIFGQHEVKIMKGHVAKDHVHLFVLIPPQVTISRLLEWLKGKSAHHLMAEFPHIKKQFWGRHLWARGYFCCSSGNVLSAVSAIELTIRPGRPEAVASLAEFKLA